MRSLLFCNEILGLGHLRISLALAGALSLGGDDTALVVTGAHGYRSLPAPPRVDVLKLPTPPVQLAQWPPGAVRQPAGLALDPETVVEMRAQLSLTAVQTMAPDVVVVDHAPLGR